MDNILETLDRMRRDAEFKFWTKDLCFLVGRDVERDLLVLIHKSRTLSEDWVKGDDSVDGGTLLGCKVRVVSTGFGALCLPEIYLQAYDMLVTMKMEAGSGEPR